MERIDFWVEIPTYCCILYMADEVHLFLVKKSMLEPMSLDSKASWRKEKIAFICKISFSLATCVILIMLISPHIFFFFSFHDFICNSGGYEHGVF